MIDIADNLINSDILFVDTNLFKSRNLLEVGVNENETFPNVYFNIDLFLNNNLSEFALNNYLATYLDRNEAYPKDFEVVLKEKNKGILEITTTYEYSILNYNTNEVVKLPNKKIGVAYGNNR